MKRTYQKPQSVAIGIKSDAILAGSDDKTIPINSGSTVVVGDAKDAKKGWSLNKEGNWSE